MKDKRADTIVIGGGITGSSIALRLAEKGQKVILLDKGRVGEEASGRNGGGVRQQARNLAELPLAMAAIDIWKNMGDELDCDVGYRASGNVIIARDEAHLDRLRTAQQNEAAMGLAVEMIGPEKIRSLVPSISDETTLLGGKFCLTDGTANPLLVVKAICRAAARKGVRIIPQEPVQRLKTEGCRVTAAVAGKTEYQAQTFVNAAGPWARGLCNTMDLDYPATNITARLLITEPLPRIVDQFVIFQGMYFRQALEGNIHIGTAGHIYTEVFDKSVPFSDFVDVGRWVAQLVPMIRRANLIRALGGVIQYTPDAIPILDKAPGYDNLFLTAGFSGHGFCLGPIVGKLISEWIVDGRSSMDLGSFGWDRFENKTPSR